VGLLPGSRAREVSRHLPLLLAAARRIAWHMPGVQFLLPKAPAIDRSMVEAALQGAGVTVHTAEGPLADSLQVMEAAVVASGTATLEAALAGVPMAVVYRTSWPTHLLAKSVVRIPHIAMVNIIANQLLVPEFVQHRARPAAVAGALLELLRDDGRCDEMKAGLRRVADQLGPPGAVERAADAVEAMLKATAAAGRS
jgi:lipid-A-disaccharide synthase